MSDHTKIEWTEATWNPITGCSVISAGCKNCYAMKLAGTRLQHHPSRSGLTIDTSNGPVWTGEVRMNQEWLDQPIKWKRPRMIFVCAHGDLFHENVPDEWIRRVFAVMAAAKQHTFQVLTKRPERMRDLLDSKDLRWIVDGLAELIDAGIIAPGMFDMQWPLPNVWLGVSVENQEATDKRIPLLLKTPAAVRWISAEPLLGPLNLRRTSLGTSDAKFYGNPSIERAEFILDSLFGAPKTGIPGIDWVVVGGESGTNARPMHPEWARSLRDQCQEAEVPFLFKQWGQFIPADQDECPCGPPHSDWIWGDGQPFERGDGQRAVPLFRRVGKKAAGRLLDGVLHDAFPEGVHP